MYQQQILLATSLVLNSLRRQSWAVRSLSLYGAVTGSPNSATTASSVRIIGTQNVRRLLQSLSAMFARLSALMA